MVTLPNNNIDNISMQGTSSKKEFDIFFKKYYTLFLSFACRYHLGTEEARDIVQDVFIAFGNNMSISLLSLPSKLSSTVP